MALLHAPRYPLVEITAFLSVSAEIDQSIDEAEQALEALVTYNNFLLQELDRIGQDATASVTYKQSIVQLLDRLTQAMDSVVIYKNSVAQNLDEATQAMAAFSAFSYEMAQQLDEVIQQATAYVVNVVCGISQTKDGPYQSVFANRPPAELEDIAQTLERVSQALDAVVEYKQTIAQVLDKARSKVFATVFKGASIAMVADEVYQSAASTVITDITAAIAQQLDEVFQNIVEGDSYLVQNLDELAQSMLASVIFGVSIDQSLDRVTQQMIVQVFGKILQIGTRHYPSVTMEGRHCVYIDVDGLHFPSIEIEGVLG